jgi:hypothetical protein
MRRPRKSPPLANGAEEWADLPVGEAAVAAAVDGIVQTAA